MLTCTIHPLGSFSEYTYVGTFVLYNGQLLLSRKKASPLWEPQGGHIEMGETPLQAAKREVYEESGVQSLHIKPLCDYSAAGTNGVCFVAQAATLGQVPTEFEMQEARLFSTLPPAACLAYPGITPLLWQYAQQHSSMLTSLTPPEGEPQP